jgi:hypothetical protein
MKKAILLALCLVLIGAGAALADSVANTTVISAYNAGNFQYNTAPGVSIPPNSIFTTPGAEFNAGVLTIYTGWSQGTVDAIGGSTATTAFLFIDANADNIWDYAIDLDKSSANLYKSTLTITNSENAGPPFSTFGTNNGLIYGRYYGGSGNVSGTTPIPVLATSDQALEDLAVAWSTGAWSGDSLTYNTVSVNLSALLGSGPWLFGWGTGTCGNGAFFDGFSIGVPLPPSALLLGTGLLGLVGLGWRRKQTSV